MSGRLVGLKALSKHCYLPTVVPVTQLWWFLAFLYGCTILPCGKWAAFLITFILLWIHVLKLFHLKTVSCAKISQLFLGYCVCNVSLLWENWKSDFLKSVLDNSSCNLPAEFFSLALAVRPGPWPDQVQSVMSLCLLKVLAVNTKLGLRDLAKGGPNSSVFHLSPSPTSSFPASPEIAWGDPLLNL